MFTIIHLERYAPYRPLFHKLKIAGYLLSVEKRFPTTRPPVARRFASTRYHLWFDNKLTPTLLLHASPTGSISKNFQARPCQDYRNEFQANLDTLEFFFLFNTLLQLNKSYWVC